MRCLFSAQHIIITKHSVFQEFITLEGSIGQGTIWCFIFRGRIMAALMVQFLGA